MKIIAHSAIVALWGLLLFTPLPLQGLWKSHAFLFCTHNTLLIFIVLKESDPILFSSLFDFRAHLLKMHIFPGC